MAESKSQETLREEFNRWAVDGKGESMEHDHWPIAKPTLDLMQIAETNNILDVGCGAGWLSRILAQRAPQGRVVGMDISDEMIGHARQAGADQKNLSFVVGTVDEIPWESNFFDRIVTVESSYYWPDPAQGVRELYRVAAHDGSAWTLINYYRDNPYCHQWGELLAVPTHLLTAARMEKSVSRRRFPKRRSPTDTRSNAKPRFLRRPLVPRCPRAGRLPGHRRAAGSRNQIKEKNGIRSCDG